MALSGVVQKGALAFITLAKGRNWVGAGQPRPWSLCDCGPVLPLLCPVWHLQEQLLCKTTGLPSWEGEEKLARGRAGTQVLGRCPCRDPFRGWCSVPVERRVQFECRTGPKQLCTLFTTHLRPGATSRLPFTSCCDFKKEMFILRGRPGGECGRDSNLWG